MGLRTKAGWLGSLMALLAGGTVVDAQYPPQAEAARVGGSAALCREVATHLVGDAREGESTAGRTVEARPQAAASRSIEWSTTAGHAGYCRLDDRGRVVSVRIETWPEGGTTVRDDWQPFTFTCASIGRRRRECEIRKDGVATFVRQVSRAKCAEGETWGVRGDVVWVSDGCRAVFRVAPAPTWETYRAYCGSTTTARQNCQIPPGAEVELIEEVRGSLPCRRGANWDVAGDRIWVERGCRAFFQVAPAGTARTPSGGFFDEPR